MEILAFCMGTLFFYAHSFSLVAGIVVFLCLKASKQILYWFLGAIAWAWIHQWLVADEGMPNTKIIPKAQLRGEISSIPAASEAKSQFQFLIHTLDNQPVAAQVLLTCYTHCPVFKVGEFWQFEAKLKHPINLQNPGHFDYVKKLNAKHIHWTGYLKAGTYRRLAAEKQTFWVQHLRENLAAKISTAMMGSSGSGIVQAITLGVANQIPKAQWDLFRRTGITHLIVISGGHIVLLAGLAYWLVECLWRRFARLCLYSPSQQAASFVGLVVALGYSLLAGFEFPVERALVAALLMFGRNILNRRFTGWQALRYGLFIIVVAEPHAVLSPGFYLSFTAVAVLISCSQYFLSSGLRKMLLLQLACLFGLMPMTLYWFSYGAINGFLANLIAIPWVSYVLVPLALLGVALMQVMDCTFLFKGLDYLIQALLVFLEAIDSSAWINFDYSLFSGVSMVALMLALGLAVFLPLKAIWPALVVIVMSVFTPQFEHLATGEARVDVLDVGQGLTVFIKTADHALLYDTGVKFYNGSDMGGLAILPYFRYNGIKRLDKVVISHPDLDHRGGLLSIEKSIPVDELIVNDPSFYHRGMNCHHYPNWHWDGVSFRFVPILIKFAKKNNTCCVLQVKTSGGSVLLPGDIEKQAEVYLVRQEQEELKSTVLVVPHHGSKTSSSWEFIQQIAPRYAIISSGFDNRYHFPHPEVLERFSRENIPVLNTMDCGMVSFILRHQKKLMSPKCYTLRT